jgi:hypothetical protein
MVHHTSKKKTQQLRGKYNGGKNLRESLPRKTKGQLFGASQEGYGEEEP